MTRFPVISNGNALCPHCGARLAVLWVDNATGPIGRWNCRQCLNRGRWQTGWHEWSKSRLSAGSCR